MILKLIKSPPLEVTMISPVLTIAEGVKVKNHNKTRIGVGSAVNAKVGEFDKIMREGMANSPTLVFTAEPTPILVLL